MPLIGDAGQATGNGKIGPVETGLTRAVATALGSSTLPVISAELFGWLLQSFSSSWVKDEVYSVNELNRS